MSARPAFSLPAAAWYHRLVVATRTALPRVAARPFLKWAGGKGQLLPQFARLYPKNIQSYLEPFVGSAAVFFDIRGRYDLRRVRLSDNNAELVNCYRAVRDDVQSLIALLGEHKARHARPHYYAVRKQLPDDLTPLERAARLIYLNKTCYNGLYRVNNRGQFNVPIGSYKNPPICDPGLLHAASEALRGVEIVEEQFEDSLGRARRGDFVYVDPPYHPVSRTANFTGYTDRGFGKADQERLAELFAELDARACKLMLSNSDTVFVRRLYSGFRTRRVLARRPINSNGRLRGAVKELVVMNYEPGE